MLKTTSNGTQASASTALKFSLRPTAETLADLSRPIDPRHLKTRKQGSATLTYCPWNTIARHQGIDLGEYQRQMVVAVDLVKHSVSTITPHITSPSGLRFSSRRASPGGREMYRRTPMRHA